MVMRMIWSFWEGLEAKANVCHHVRLIHVSTSSHFPPLLAGMGGGGAEDGDRDGEKGTVGRHFRPVYAGAPHCSTNVF